MAEATDIERALSELNAKTLAGKLRAMMPTIIAQTEAGIKQPDIIAALNAGGLDINLNTLRVYIHRYRKKTATKSSAGAVAPEEQGSVGANQSAGASVGIPEPTTAEEVEPAAVEADKNGPAFDTRRLKSVGDKYTTKAPALFGAAKRGN